MSVLIGLCIGWTPIPPFKYFTIYESWNILFKKKHFRFDVTRVQFTVPLREHFSLPFIFMQFFFVGKYLSFRQTSSNYVVMTLIYISGVLFTICWQFSQFVMLIQSLVLFVLATVGLAGKEKRQVFVKAILKMDIW